MTQYLVCSQKNCELFATWSYCWPGEPERIFSCDRCKEQAVGISEAMGFQLSDVRKEATPEIEEL